MRLAHLMLVAALCGVPTALALASASSQDAPPPAQPPLTKLPPIPKDCPYVLKFSITGKVFNNKEARKAISFTHRQTAIEDLTFTATPKKGDVGCIYMGRNVVRGSMSCNPGGDQSGALFAVADVKRGITCVKTFSRYDGSSYYHHDSVTFAVRKRR